ncbi:hypothetical protein ACCQ08_15915 [Comamonas sp. SY3]
MSSSGAWQTSDAVAGVLVCPVGERKSLPGVMVLVTEGLLRHA